MYANQRITSFIQDSYVEDLKYFQNKNQIEINIFEDNLLGFSDYKLEFYSKTNKVIDKIEKISLFKKFVPEKEIKNKKFINSKKKDIKKKKFYKKKYFKKKIK